MDKLVRHDESHALLVRYSGGLGVNEESRFAVRDKTPIFHSASREVWDGNQVALADGVLKVENLGERKCETVVKRL
jgi:hypothetical protein